MADRVALLVLGMHRSGSSALTRLLSLHGLALPASLMAPREDNPRGFWEPASVQQFDDRVLAELGCAWDDPRPLPWHSLPPARLEALRDEAARIVAADYGTAPLIVMKEPRMARLMPIWRPALAGLGIAMRVALPLRNPLEVAASLAARNGTTKPAALALWLGHVLAAERDSRGLPRAVVQYDLLLADWRAALAPVLALLPGHAPPDGTAIGAFLSSALRHQFASTDTLLRDAEVPAGVKLAYAELRRHPGGGAIDGDLLDLLARRAEAAA